MIAIERHASRAAPRFSSLSGCLSFSIRLFDPPFNGGFL